MGGVAANKMHKMHSKKFQFIQIKSLIKLRVGGVRGWPYCSKNLTHEAIPEGKGLKTMKGIF